MTNLLLFIQAMSIIFMSLHLRAINKTLKTLSNTIHDVRMAQIDALNARYSGLPQPRRSCGDAETDSSGG